MISYLVEGDQLHETWLVLRIWVLVTDFLRTGGMVQIQKGREPSGLLVQTT